MQILINFVDSRDLNVAGRKSLGNSVKFRHRFIKIDAKNDGIDNKSQKLRNLELEEANF